MKNRLEFVHGSEIQHCSHRPYLCPNTLALPLFTCIFIDNEDTTTCLCTYYVQQMLAWPSLDTLFISLMTPLKIPLLSVFYT